MKLDLGGGIYPKKGFTNVDSFSGDVKCDFNIDSLPFEDNSIDEIYSSHCFEHLSGMGHILREIIRVCKNGARVEIRTPHPGHDLGMCPAYMPFEGHKGIFSEWWWKDCLVHFHKDWSDKGKIIIDSFWHHKSEEYSNHPKNLIPKKFKDLFDNEKQFGEFSKTYLRNYIQEFAMIGHIEK